MHKKRKAGMRIVQGERAGPAPGKPGHTEYESGDPDPFRIPLHIKDAYNSLAVSEVRKRLAKTKNWRQKQPVMYYSSSHETDAGYRSGRASPESGTFSSKSSSRTVSS